MLFRAEARYGRAILRLPQSLPILPVNAALSAHGPTQRTVVRSRNRPLTTGGYLSPRQTRILRGMSTESSSFELTIPVEPADIRNITAREESIA